MPNHRDLTIDGDLVRALASLLAETGLSEIEYAVGDHRIRVAREVQTQTQPPPAPSGANGHAVHGQAGNHPLPPAASAEPAAADESAAVAAALTSPMVGVAYLAPQPGAAPFVQIGERVSEGQTLLIIEAMKVMNQIRAPRAGQVTRVFIEDGTPVEYGAPLLLIE